MRRRIKCELCHGERGVWVQDRRGFGLEVFIPCQACAGKGLWWPNNKPKKKPKEAKR